MTAARIAPRSLPHPPNSCALTISARAPFRLDRTVWALRRRPRNIVDRWDGATYRRVFALGGGAPIEVAVRQTGGRVSPRLHVEIHGVDVPTDAAKQVRALLERMLGLRADLSEFYRFAYATPALHDLAARFRGLKPPRFPSVFEALVNGITCQQLSLTVGIELLNRLCRTCGPSVGGPSVPDYGFPGPDEVLGLDVERLRGLGYSRQKARTLLETARRVAHREIDLDNLATLDRAEAMAMLEALPGVGRWTAVYALLRGMGAWEVFPGDDVGARNALRRHLGRGGLSSYESVLRATAPWAPYSGLVYFHLLLAGLTTSGVLVSRGATADASAPPRDAPDSG